jgi:hypothetical protein
MKLLICVVCILFVGLMVALFQALAADQKQWEAFKAEHHCHVVTRIKGSTSVGYGGKNPVIIQEPDKTGWLCDDGITYVR